MIETTNNTGRKSLDIIGNDPRVVEVWYKDSDGYQVDLRVGWRDGAHYTHSLHENTVRELLMAYRSIEACDCAECQHECGPECGCED